jgi:uncharacterized membrane protein
MARIRWRRLAMAIRSRPRLAASAALGLAVGVGCALFAKGMRPSTTWIAGWDATCAAYLITLLPGVSGQGPDEIRARAARDDEGRGLILGLVLAASLASLWAMRLELELAKATPLAWDRALHVSVAFATVGLSWLMVQMIFALHYAHAYYTVPDEAAGKDRGGLAFPGGEAPDYWDFVHFSIVIGVAAQTADVAFTSKRLRRLGTVHSLIAFAFNTVVVALTINLLAGLF